MAFNVSNFAGQALDQQLFSVSLRTSQFPQIGPSFTPAPGFSPMNTGPAQLIGILQQLMSSLAQLAQGWQGALGAPGFPQPGFPQPGFPQPGFPQPGFPQPGFPQPPVYGTPFPPTFPPGYPTQPPPWTSPGHPAPGYPTQPGYPPVLGPTQPGYPGGQPGGVPPYPSDPRDFASYLEAQRKGGALQGNTSISQADALPGTRFAQVQNPNAWHASVGRNYAYQFAAYAVGADPLSPEGLAQGAAQFGNMSPDAQLFTQVASVFKGNMIGGPGFYNNPGLKELLISRGLGDLANRPGVGQSDVQTIGAITQALNRGALTLNDIIQSGTIDNMDRYFQVINYVQGGNFAADLRHYDSVPL